MSKKISILFVDDEPNVLTAIKRMLRAKRNDWNMAFAESGIDALALFEKTEFDVIVSDIRMPGMDGAKLLNKIKDKYPRVLRIALSGQVNLNEVVTSIQAVHQYISKPCETGELVKKIERAFNSRDILTDPDMQCLVAKIDTLPVIPKVFQLIQKELKKKEPSIDKVAEFISMDVGLVSKIIKLVNSPYFGLPSHINSIFQAITMLGLETIQALIISTHLFSMHTAKNIPNFSLKQLWAHSFRVSNIARLIAQCESVSENIIVQAGMAGLLHDVGKLILASSFPDKYMRVMNRVAETKKPIYNCEMEEFGSTHAQVGAYLMGLWGMSNKTIHGIGYHHQHEKFDRSVQMFVSIANTIDHQCVIIHPDYVRIGISEKLLPESKREKQLKKWIDYINNHLEGVDDMQIVNADLLKCAKK